MRCRCNRCQPEREVETLSRRGRISLLFITVLSLYVAPPKTAAEDPYSWRFSTGGVISARPVQGPDGTIYTLSEDRYLYALTINGVLKWRCPLGARVGDGLSVAWDGTIYATMKSRGITAVNPGGRIAWKFVTDGSPVGSPAIQENGMLYFGTNTGVVYCLSHAGRMLWMKHLPDAVSGSPSLDADGTVILPCVDNRLYAFTPWGDTEWIFLAAGVPTAAAVGADSTLYIGTDSGTLAAVTHEGELSWNVTLGGPVTVPVIDAEAVYVSSEYRGVASFWPDGTLRWSFSQDDPPVSGLSLGASKAYFSTKGGGLCTVPKAGGESVTVKGAKMGKSPLLTKNGLVVTGGDDWIVYAYPAESPDSPYWPMPGRDAASSSCMPGAGIRARITVAFSETFDYRYARGSALSSDMERKNAFLAGVRASLESTDRVSYKPYYPLLLEESAAEGIHSITARVAPSQRSYPSYRVAAYSLLGLCGDLRSRTVILDLLRYEWDGVAMDAGIEALGLLGNDVDGKSVELIEQLFQGSERMEAGTAMAMVTALDRIGKYGGYTEKNRRILVALFTGDYPREVREAALRVLRGIAAGVPESVHDAGGTY